MNKEEFLRGLRQKLSFLPQEEAEERIAFYSEMIDDRVEEGMTEEEAIASIGRLDGVADQVLSEIPLTTLVVRRVKPENSKKGLIILILILGAPLWFGLLVGFVSAIFSVYAAVWSIAISVFAAALSFAAGAVGLLVMAVFLLFTGKYFVATFSLGGAMVMAGLSILTFIGGLQVSKLVIRITKKFLLWVKSLFVKKGGSQ